MNSVLENQTRLQYQLLKHGGYWSRVGYQDKQSNEKKKPWKEDLIFGVDALLKWARPLTGRYNLYISRNPRNKDGKVAGVSCFSVDADPVREPETAALPEQHERAIQVGRRIVASFGEGVLASSGNGALVLFPFEQLVTENLDVYEAKAKAFERELIKRFETPEVTIDATNYANAVIKLLGHQSTKGDPKLWRPARFLSLPAIFAKRSRVREAINGISVPLAGSTSAATCADNVGDGRSVTLVGAVGTVTGLGPSDRLRLAEQSLKRLKPERADDYDSWLRVGIALKEFGDAGLRMWDDWSRQSSKYVQGSCAEKFRTFRPDQSITVGSLKYWADQDSPQSQLVVLVRPPVSGMPLAVWTPVNGLSVLRDSPRGHSGYATGFRFLDEKLGGYQPGSLYAVEAPTNIGKSTFIVQAANQLCRSGKRVLLVITEMDVKEAVQRLAACDTGLPANQLLSPVSTASHRERLGEFEERFKKYPLAVHYTTSPDQAVIEHLIRQEKPDALLWDYFQHFETGDESRQIQLASLARWFESTALQYQIPVVVAAQLHRNIDFKSKRVVPSSMDLLKDCKVLNDAAKVVLTLNWSQEDATDDNGPVPVTLTIEKNKGPHGSTAIRLDRSIPRFGEM